MAEPLSDPQWSEAAAVCPACGYSLAGLTPPIPCPECGAPYTGRQFVLYGVPSARSVMSRGRLLGVIALCGVVAVLPQLIMVLWITVSGWVSLAIFGACGAVALVMFLTSPKSEGGKSRFVFTAGGVDVLPLRAKPGGAAPDARGFIPFKGDEQLSMKRVSPVWARLRIGRRGERPVFDAGVRCPRLLQEQVLRTVNQAIRGKAPEDGEALTPEPPQNENAGGR